MTSLGYIATTARRVLTLALGQGDPNRRGCSYAVTVITPIKPGHTGDLRSLLAGYQPGPASPLAEVPDVQFARWVIIDQLRTDWPGAPKPAPRLNSEYLLFSADLTAPAHRADSLPDSFFHDLAARIPAAADEVWGHCLQYPYPGAADAETFVDYMKKSQITIGLYYTAYPDATVDDVKHALAVRTELREFAADAQDAAPGTDLKNEYLTRSESW